MEKIGPLKCIVVEKDTHNLNSVLVLFHGYGADAYDLQTLADAFEDSPQAPSTYIFPQGLLEVPIGPGWSGRAWWHIDLNRLQMAQAQGQNLDLSEHIPDGLPKAREKALEFLKSLDLNGKKLFLGGFSQGAMLATDLACILGSKNLAGLIVFSGQLINKADWTSKSTNLEGLPVFLSHGQQDAVLPFAGASRLENFFRKSGAKVDVHFFQGTHEIPPLCIEKSKKIFSFRA